MGALKINVDNAKLHIYILDKVSRYYDKLAQRYAMQAVLNRIPADKAFHRFIDYLHQTGDNYRLRCNALKKLLETYSDTASDN